MTDTVPPVSVDQRTSAISGWDVVAMLLVLGLIVLVADASRGATQTLADLQARPVSIDPLNLPEYAARTTVRMLAAMALSLAFTLTYATWAAKSRRAAMVLIPLLDILQSVPILGFLSVTVVFFLSLAPGRVLGAELAAVFAIFTSQAWNMAFSFYQSLRTVPNELSEASRNFGLSPWMRFWRLDVPFAMPSLVWNMMMSMSGGWFFVVASEAISVGDTTITLPGIGSYIAVAIRERDGAAIAWAIGAMLVVVLICDVLLFRPLVAWSDRFRFEQQPGDEAPRAWALVMLQRSRIGAVLAAGAGKLLRRTGRLHVRRRRPAAAPGTSDGPVSQVVWYALIAALVGAAVWKIASFVGGAVSLAEVGRVFGLGLLTMLRVFVLIAIASAVWVPVGIWFGLRPGAARIAQPIAQFLAAFPANLLFPLFVSAIVSFRLDPDVWLSPLMVLGTQWYILFNVIAGAAALPNELRDAASNLRVSGALWWQRVSVPAVMPYFLTGAITASGGSWNASIVSEVASWGAVRLEAAGLGSYIAKATAAGDFHRVVLGIAVMSVYVILINRVFWRPLYRYAERRFRLS